MRITEAVKRLVWVKAGGICSFSGCGRSLIEEATEGDDAVMLGKVAHIVGHSEDGPRGDQPVPGGDRDGEKNLLLLCPDHHELIDAQPNTYTVERLLGIKDAHQQQVLQRLRIQPASQTPANVAELVHSTLLSVEQIPRYIYTSPCTLHERDVFSKITFPANREILLPFIVREKKLITFADLTDSQGPFARISSEPEAAEKHETAAWLRDDQLNQWLVTLLNRAIGKYTTFRGLRYDKEHQRYYFEPNQDEDGKAVAREESYRPMNQASSTKQVAWNPVFKKTGEAKRFWTHLAAGLRFHRVSPSRWVLSIRPEHRFTTDGYTPLSPKGTGKRSTKTKSHMYNNQLLSEVVFWRSFLTRDQPRILLNFGAQSLIIDGQLMASDVRWPGVQDDAIPFANTDAEDDLFSSAAYARALSNDTLESELDNSELDDIAVLEAEAEDEVIDDVS